MFLVLVFLFQLVSVFLVLPFRISVNYNGRYKDSLEPFFILNDETLQICIFIIIFIVIMPTLSDGITVET